MTAASQAAKRSGAQKLFAVKMGKLFSRRVHAAHYGS